MLRDAQAFSSFSVDDAAAARRFYGETLGLEVSDVPMGEGMTLLSLSLAGGGRVLAYPKDDHRPATFTVLNFAVADVEAAVEALSERGVRFERYEGTAMETDARGVFRGGGPLIAWFADPAGNVLSVVEEA